MKKLTKHFTLIELMIVVAIIAIIATIAVPQLMDARRNSNERAAIGSMRSMNTDQETYKVDNTTYATLALLKSGGKANLADPKAGYTFSDLIVAPTADCYAVAGIPTTPGSSGRKVFVVTCTGTVRTETAVTTAFATSNAAGILAITAAQTAGHIAVTIAAAAEQAGIDAINTNVLFPEAK